jgi:hypothetical protein
LEHGIAVYPARVERGRWRAVWHEGGERQQCEAASEEKLAAWTSSPAGGRLWGFCGDLEIVDGACVTGLSRFLRCRR